MYPGFDLYRFLQGLHENLLQQKDEMARLQQSILQLSDEVKALQEKPNTHIDKIEYHFDQLKVEKLEGTLNIGITPQAGGTIEDYAAGQTYAQDLTVKPQPEDIFRSIQEKVYQYLNQEAGQEIKSMESRYNKIVGTEYRQMMIEDVRRQVDGRIREYLDRQSASADAADDSSVEENIVSRIKRDIRTALHNYFQNLPKQGGESNETGGRQ